MANRATPVPDLSLSSPHFLLAAQPTPADAVTQSEGSAGDHRPFGSLMADHATPVPDLSVSSAPIPVIFTDNDSGTFNEDPPSELTQLGVDSDDEDRDGDENEDEEEDEDEDDNEDEDEDRNGDEDEDQDQDQDDDENEDEDEDGEEAEDPASGTEATQPMPVDEEHIPTQPVSAVDGTSVHLFSLPCSPSLPFSLAASLDYDEYNISICEYTRLNPLSHLIPNQPICPHSCQVMPASSNLRGRNCRTRKPASLASPHPSPLTAPPQPPASVPARSLLVSTFPFTTVNVLMYVLRTRSDFEESPEVSVC
jgi:hypothetical protein